MFNSLSNKELIEKSRTRARMLSLSYYLDTSEEAKVLIVLCDRLEKCSDNGNGKPS